MTASDTVAALERNLITEAEAVDQAMADDLGDLYRKSIIELAPRFLPQERDARRPC